jgi:predicted enzyme related to lactoylglutathione lyase
MSGEVGHFELPADQPARARQFYGAVFGWQMKEMPGMDYTMVATGPLNKEMQPSAPGYIGGGLTKRGGHVSHPVITIIVDEIADAEKAIEKHGGHILQRKQPIGDGSMGHTGYFKDTEGNIVGLYQSPKH